MILVTRKMVEGNTSCPLRLVEHNESTYNLERMSARDQDQPDKASLTGEVGVLKYYS